LALEGTIKKTAIVLVKLKNHEKKIVKRVCREWKNQVRQSTMRPRGAEKYCRELKKAHTLEKKISPTKGMVLGGNKESSSPQ